MKLKGRYFHADEQAGSLAILLSNKLGYKMYSTVAPMMGLPLARQARKVRTQDLQRNCSTFFTGLNDWSFKAASEREVRPLHNSMDGTRVVRTIELYSNECLLRKAFPPDVRQFPNGQKLPGAGSWEQIQEYILPVRVGRRYAAEVYSFDLVDKIGKLLSKNVWSIPEATPRVTVSHIFALMLVTDKKARCYTLSLVGH